MKSKKLKLTTDLLNQAELEKIRGGGRTRVRQRIDGKVEVRKIIE